MQREVESDAWRAALARAEGAKVYDDPKQLRRTIKAEQKAKTKRQDAWKERTDRQQQGMVAKQQKCEPLATPLLRADGSCPLGGTMNAQFKNMHAFHASAHMALLQPCPLVVPTAWLRHTLRGVSIGPGCITVLLRPVAGARTI